MVLLEFSMFPIGKGESLSPYVARCLDVIDKSGVEYRINPMGTVLEGEWDQVFGVVRECFDELREDCDRIEVTMKVDYRKGVKDALSGKIKSVERKLGRQLKK